MSWLGNLLGTSGAVEKTIDIAGRITDEAFYTKEEESADKAKATTEARGYLIRWLETTTGSRLARRMLALSTASVWMGQYVLAGICSFAAVFTEEVRTAKLNTAAALMDARANMMIEPVMLVWAFYFAAPHMGEFAKALLSRWQQRGMTKND